MNKIVLKYAFFFLALTCACPVFAQKADTSKNIPFHEVAISSISHSPPVQYIIDGREIADSLAVKTLKDFNANDILEITILKDSSNAAIASSPVGSRNAVIIITKQYAQKKNQEKLSTFAKDYKNYIDGLLKSSDEDCFYFLNGGVIGPENETEIIKTLYDLPKDKIKTVEFINKIIPEVVVSRKPIIMITTTK